jgi:hypothetical protein
MWYVLSFNESGCSYAETCNYLSVYDIAYVHLVLFSFDQRDNRSVRFQVEGVSFMRLKL